jgi:hypothetical protein
VLCLWDYVSECCPVNDLLDIFYFYMPGTVAETTFIFQLLQVISCCKIAYKP